MQKAILGKVINLTKPGIAISYVSQDIEFCKYVGRRKKKLPPSKKTLHSHICDCDYRILSIANDYVTSAYLLCYYCIIIMPSRSIS